MTTPANPGFPPVPLKDANLATWVRRIAETVNRILTGKLNATVTVTLAANAASTIVTDSRISGTSYLGLAPQTAHAAAALATSPYVLPTDQAPGTVTFTHANDANTDKTFTLLIIG